MKIPEIHTIWTNTINDSKYMEYFFDSIERWKLQHKKLITYININKKRPSNSSEDSFIKLLAEWIHTQIRSYNSDITKSKQIMKTPEIHKIWTNMINDYSKYFKQ